MADQADSPEYDGLDHVPAGLGYRRGGSTTLASNSTSSRSVSGWGSASTSAGLTGRIDRSSGDSLQAELYGYVTERCGLGTTPVG